MPSTKETKLIHVARRTLTMSDDAYREMLKRVAGVESSKSLTPLGVARVLREFQRLGFTATAPAAGRTRPRVPVNRDAMMGKIEALLTASRRPWAYADAMAQHMFAIQRVNWLDAVQMQKLIAALSIDARRAGRECDK